MPQLALIFLGGLIPPAVAFSLGFFCLRRAAMPRVIQLGVGAVIESILIFGLLIAGFATPAAFAVLAAITLLPLTWFIFRGGRGFSVSGPFSLDRLALFIFIAYGALYLVHALAPEIQPDAVAYHLGLVNEYARTGSFPDRIAFFEMLPQGFEMLFLFAFTIGKHSAAKLVHLAFLAATIPLMILIGRRLQVTSRATTAAAVFYFCAPVVGVTGTCAYTDAALVFFVLATFYVLLLWKEQGDSRRLIPAGLLAGFCYAIKMSGLTIPAAGFLFVLTSRRAKPAMLFVLATLVPIAPWMVRSAVLTGNPVAPLFNAVFPNPYFHLPMEQSLKAAWRSYYEGFTYLDAPWELAVGGRLHGILGPVYLIMPLGLLALRQRAGRWCWIAAGILALPWLSNVGTRFLMPSLPFLALALAMALERSSKPVLWACMLFHAATCWPGIADRYRRPLTWGLPALPWRSALRLEPERDYLIRASDGIGLADLLRKFTRPEDRIFSLVDVPRAYLDREIRLYWQSALADRMTDALKLASTQTKDSLFDLQAAWPAQTLTGLRVRLTEPSPNEWWLHEVQLFFGEDRVFSSPHWSLRAWPNEWETPVAVDGNLASSWRTWTPMRRGMFYEIIFDRPQVVSSAVLVCRAPISGAPADFYGLRADGAWQLLSHGGVAKPRPREDLRRAAAGYLLRNGFDYILVSSNQGPWSKIAAMMIDGKEGWGFVEAGKAEDAHLLRIVR